MIWGEGLVFEENARVRVNRRGKILESRLLHHP
jgi:hypothetical protein